MASLCAVLAGCEHPENYRWSAFANPVMPQNVKEPPGSTFSWKGPSVNVYSYAAPATPKTTTGVKDLSDRGQAAFIAKLSIKGADASKIGSTLSKPLGASASDEKVEGAATIDESYSRTLVATVSEGLDAGPADRLVWTWVDIQPLNFSFKGYTLVATDNETLNIESIQNQSNASLTAQLGDTSSNTQSYSVTNAPPSAIGGTTLVNALSKVMGSSAGVSGTLSNQNTTSAIINQQYEKLHVDIKSSEMRILRASERNLDATGNTLVALTLQVNPNQWLTHEIVVQRVTKLSLVKSGKLLAPEDIDISMSLEKAPPHCPLQASVSMAYLQRKVSNARSYIEGQQSPEYLQDVTTPQTVDLVPADIVRPPSFRVFGTINKEAVQIFATDTFNQRQPLDFTSYEQARDFAAWLTANAAWLARGGSNRPIGKAGYVISSQVSDIALPPPPFYAKAYEDPNQAKACAEVEAGVAAAKAAGQAASATSPPALAAAISAPMPH